MKRIIRNDAAICLWIFSFLLLATTVEAQSARKATDTLRLFLIGNSFSQNASRYLPELAKEGNHPLKIGRAELGGCPLERHWKHAAAAEANPADSSGKPYGGKSLRMLLSQDKWDIVTIQQASILSGDSTTYYPYASNLYNYVKSICPGAEIVIHQTWAYRSDESSYGQIAPPPQKKLAKTDEEMYLYSRAAYHKVAGELGIRVLPVGDAFWQVTSDPTHQYKKDTAFNYVNPIYPAEPVQTNSLHVGYSWVKDKLKYDGHHANAAGCFLGALVWYKELFHESPAGLQYYPPKMDAAFASYLKTVVDKQPGKLTHSSSKR